MKKYLVDIKEFNTLNISSCTPNPNIPAIKRTPMSVVVLENDLDKWKLLLANNSIFDYTITELTEKINVPKKEGPKKKSVVTKIPARPSNKNKGV